MKFKNILVPVDGSEHSERALRCALELAKCQEARVTVLHSFGNIPMLIGGDGRRELVTALREESRKLMEPFIGILREAGMPEQFIAREGRAAQVIVDEAKEGGFDLIVMGSRGLSEVAGVLMGSVAHRVLCSAHCPVLVTR
ncbi:MAG: hypothetical protein A2051_06650 [Desulfovibrionales bacterium GWA2_65_9]|nr:MAG: hypothetical protein A2051_06650 [Desulfovibrionales bacterium GWA2_65_9]